MIRAHRADDVRAAEADLMRALRSRQGSVPPDVLMQRAAAGLATACVHVLRERYGRVTGRRVVLLVGAGANGGDALWAGARLRARGVAVHAVLAADSVHESGLAGLRAAGGRASPGDDVRGAAALAHADLVVDGLVGTGGRPGLRASAVALVAAIPRGVPVVAVDLSSGLDPDGGACAPPHVRADLVVTFGTAKPCHLLPPAAGEIGALHLVDIGLAPFLPAPQVERLQDADVAERWPVPAAGDDKYRRGVLGVVAGGTGYPGAAVLCLGGALAAGVGMVRYVGPDDVARAVLARWPEVVVGSGRVQAWLVGPGIDVEHDEGRRHEVADALASGVPVVVDAGALHLLGEVAHARADAGASVLLTPHAGELARLLDVPRDQVEADPARHARQAALRTGATVLLKGATTLVVPPHGPIRSQAAAPSWLATAGAGDVLAGIAGSLMAAGLPALEAGSVAAQVHGLAAGDASEGGPITAMDVVHGVASTVRRLLAPR